MFISESHVTTNIQTLRPTWLEVDLTAIANNVQQLRRKSVQRAA